MRRAVEGPGGAQTRSVSRAVTQSMRLGHGLASDPSTFLLPSEPPFLQRPHGQSPHLHCVIAASIQMTGLVIVTRAQSVTITGSFMSYVV